VPARARTSGKPSRIGSDKIRTHLSDKADSLSRAGVDHQLIMKED
jgi:hypothetical protein